MIYGLWLALRLLLNTSAKITVDSWNSIYSTTILELIDNLQAVAQATMSYQIAAQVSAQQQQQMHNMII